MYALRRLLSGDARVTDADTFPTRTLTRWQRQDLQIFEIDVRFQSEDFTYRLEVEHERPSKKARIHVERLLADGRPLFECSQGEVKLYRDNHSPGPNYAADWSESALARVASRGDNTRLTSFLEFMRKVLVCGIHPPSIVTESDGEAPLLERDGRNFSDWYRHVLQERPDLAHEFTNTLKQALGAELKGIRLERIGHETRALMVAFVDREDVESQESYELRFEEISDGQRALVALYGLTQLSSDQGYTLFLDEPENYVALPEIQPWLMNLENACGATLSQEVITSHHPELIDYLGGEHGVLLDREVSGVVTTRKPQVGADTDGLRLSELIARGWDE